jgi:hypothetical protein
MKEKQSKSASAIKAECDFRNVKSYQIEACCYYEYFRESAAMCEAFKQGRPMPLQGYRDGDVHDYVRLRAALTTAAGFPIAWKRLSPEQRAMLAKPLYSTDGKQYFGTGVLDWRLKDTDKHPPLLVKEFLPGHDPLEAKSLLEQWKQEAYYDAPVGRSYFFGLFRLDESYNETDAREAFTAWFRKRYPKTKSGGRDDYKAKLNDLVVMRLRKHFPKRKDAIRRVEYVAKFTTAGFKGCKDWWENFCRARKEKRSVDRQIGKPANEEMSRARADALKFFETLFPDEKPLSY